MNGVIIVDDMRFVKKFLITRVSIIGTPYVMYDVWVPGEDGSTITFINGQKYYKLTTKTLPEKLDVLPAMTKERFDRVRTWRNRLDKAARNLILKAYPDAKIDKNFIEVID
ncbi:MAG: hypothetical protein BPH43C_34 [Phage 5P_1]|nr:MAG: hypothetical protein BPH43C_34 [Phage 5P_1]